MHRHLAALLLAASGAVSLTYELVWIRRLSLILGGSAVASAVGVGAWMAGMGLGAWWAARLGSRVRDPWRTYALLELVAATWALAFPKLTEALAWAAVEHPWARWPMAVVLVGCPALALGATWPVLVERAEASAAGLLYAANTAGAVLGVTIATFWALPALGVRGTELGAAALAALVAAVAFTGRRPPTRQAPPARVPGGLLAVAAVAGVVSLGLEVTWMRLAAVAFGATVQTVGGVLAVFLALVAVGAALGARWGRPDHLGPALAATGGLALVGALAWGQLPFALALAWRAGGPAAMLPASLGLALVAMGGAPLASGACFSLAVRHLGSEARGAGQLAAANTAGAVLGAWGGGLLLVPTLGIGGTVSLLAALAVSAGAGWSGRPRWLLLGCLLAVIPPWDARLYAVGLHLRVSDFADPSRSALRAFVDEGWDLLSYRQGATAAVAVGRSRRTGNVWLSINGKVDASTGDDMPTQLLSGEIPLAVHPDPRHVVVVGLASGVTAGAVLRSPRVRRLDLLELEPAVVEASHAFDHVNGRPLADPRTHLVIDDARAWLARQGAVDVIVSEPSNPWISGVSNLFTEDYWRMAKQHLAPEGVFAQWVQLYGMGPEEVRGILRTFAHVFGDVWVFETLPGADLLVIGGPTRLPDDLPLAPLLGPDQVRCLAGRGWLNTDDRPHVEWRAPRYLHYDTTEANATLLREALTCRPGSPSGPAPPRR